MADNDKKNTSEYKTRLSDKSDHYGKSNGLPVRFFRALSDLEIDQMDARALATALREIQASYDGVVEKMIQYADHVNKEILKRDPSAEIAIFLGVNDGRTDEDLAEELGEKVRFVQEQRLSIAGGQFKRPRGRPQKGPNSP